MGIYRTTLALFFLATLSLGLNAQNTSTSVDRVQGSSARILQLAKEHQARTLLAFGRAARDEAKFEDAITFFQASLQSSAGRQEFIQKMTGIFEKVDQEWEQFYSPHFILKGGRMANGRGFNRQVDGLFGISFDSFTDDLTTGVQAYTISFEFYGLKKPQRENQEGTELPWSEIEGFFAAMIRRAATEFGTTFPNNPLRFIKQGRYYRLEGVMNADYPQMVAQGYYELAKTYRMQGDYPMAIRYFQTILGRSLLAVANDQRIDILYQLIDIQQVTNPNDVPRYAREIIVADPQFDIVLVNAQAGQTNNRNRLRAMVNTLKTQGLDKTISLHRFDYTFSTRAHLIMGIVNQQGGSYEEALQHLAYAAVQVITKAMVEIRSREYFYEFTSMKALVEKANSDPILKGFFNDSSLYEILFYLGLVLETQQNGRTLARPVYQAIIAGSDAGLWKTRAESRI